MQELITAGFALRIVKVLGFLMSCQVPVRIPGAMGYEIRITDLSDFDWGLFA